jgi:hypothetical protein
MSARSSIPYPKHLAAPNHPLAPPLARRAAAAQKRRGPPGSSRLIRLARIRLLGTILLLPRRRPPARVLEARPLLVVSKHLPIRSLGSQKVATLGWMVAAAFNARPRISQTHSSGFSPSTPGHGPPDTPLECTLTVASLKPHRHPRKEPPSRPNGHHLPHRHIRRSLPPALQHHPPRNANPLPPPSPPNPNQHQPSIRQTTVFEP